MLYCTLKCFSLLYCSGMNVVVHFHYVHMPSLFTFLLWINWWKLNTPVPACTSKISKWLPIRRNNLMSTTDICTQTIYKYLEDSHGSSHCLFLPISWTNFMYQIDYLCAWAFCASHGLLLCITWNILMYHMTILMYHMYSSCASYGLFLCITWRGMYLFDIWAHREGVIS